MNYFLTEVNGLVSGNWAVRLLRSPPVQPLSGSCKQPASSDPSQDCGEGMLAIEGFLDLEDVCDESDVSETREEEQIEDSEGEDSEQLDFHCDLVSKGVSRNNKRRALEILDIGRTRKGQTGKRRGRKSRAEVGSAILREVSEGSGGVDPTLASLQAEAERTGSGGYFTRATKAWLLGKGAGLRYPGTDAEAIKGLAEELAEDWPVHVVA